MIALHIDFESRGVVELGGTGGAGVHAYAEHPLTDLWCAAYAFGDGPIRIWWPFERCPDDIRHHVYDGGVIYAHNAAFERVMWHYILSPRYGWPEPDIAQWRCTMVMAYAMALPGALDKAAAALGMDLRKDEAGHRLMMQMAKPRRKAPLTWWDTPDKIERLIAYCKQDVEVERELGKRLRPLKQSELDLWHLDQRINDRGVMVDVGLATAAKKIVEAHSAVLDRRICEVTGYAVTRCSNRNQLIAWVREQGVETESIAKDVVEELLADTALPAVVREALLLRQEAAKASVAKIDALLVGMNADGRARGLLQFHAASTGRWAGRRFQPQNIKRPERKKLIDAAIEVILTGDVDLVTGLFDHPLSIVGDCLRGMIRAAPGNKIVAADYANIEGRVLAWLGNERWKIDAFRAYDRKEGPDLYLVGAGAILGKPWSEVTDEERQAYGKVPELALGYQGGVGAFQTMAVNYGVDLPDAVVEKIRDGWRAKHPGVVALWRDIESAAVAAAENPGATTDCSGGRIVFRRAGSFLFMRLPSGRFLAYAYPQMAPKTMPWTDYNGDPVIKSCLSFMGVNSYTRKWERCFTYGGSLVENAVQAIARDIMADAMPRLEAAGYPLVLTVHDEIVAECPVEHGSVEEFERIMRDLPAWVAGCPISAAGFQAERYRK